MSIAALSAFTADGYEIEVSVPSPESHLLTTITSENGLLVAACPSGEVLAFIAPASFSHFVVTETTDFHAGPVASGLGLSTQASASDAAGGDRLTGRRVRVTSGLYSGSTGIVRSEPDDDDDEVAVRFDNGDFGYVLVGSLEFLDEEKPS